MRLLNCFDRLIEWTATATVAVMLSLVLAQIFYRYVLNSPLGATQELSIFSTMLFVMLGVAIAFKRKEHISVNFFVNMLPRPLKILSHVLANLVVLIFLGTLAYQSWLLSERAMLQTSPTTGISIGFITLFITLGCVLSLIYLMIQYLELWRGKTIPLQENTPSSEDCGVPVKDER